MQQCGTSLRKINKHVEFPLLLDMAPFCSSSCQTIQPGQEKVMYSLYGVVEHSGRMSGGHYVAFVKVCFERGSEIIYIQTFYIYDIHRAIKHSSFIWNSWGTDGRMKFTAYIKTK